MRISDWSSDVCSSDLFSRTGKIRLHLAPPLLSRLDPRTGRPAKRRFGPWIFTAMALLAKGKRLRGSWADLFGRTAERMAERRLRDEYLDQIEALSARVDAATLPLDTANADFPRSEGRSVGKRGV